MWAASTACRHELVGNRHMPPLGGVSFGGSEPAVGRHPRQQGENSEVWHELAEIFGRDKLSLSRGTSPTAATGSSIHRKGIRYECAC